MGRVEPHIGRLEGKLSRPGRVPPARFVAVGFIASYLLPYQVLMVWVYDRINGLLVARLRLEQW